MSVIAFHENAGGCQVNFDFVFVFAILSPPFFLAERFCRAARSSQGRLVLGAAQRTLDGEDGSAIVRLGRKVSLLNLQFVSCISACTLWPPRTWFALLLSPPFHPHSDWAFSFARCKLGVLVYSRCCNLIFDLSSISRWNRARRLTQSPELGGW